MKQAASLLAGLALSLPHAPVLAHGELLVGNKSDDTVWRLSLEDGRKLGEIASGAGPHEIAVSSDGRTAIVTDYGHQAPGRTLTMMISPTARHRAASTWGSTVVRTACASCPMATCW